LALATSIGIALVVFVLAASQMLSQGMRTTLINTGSPQRAIVLEHDAFSERGSDLRQSVRALVAAAPGVKKNGRGQPLVQGESLLQMSLARKGNTERLSSVLVRGVEDSVLELRPRIKLASGTLPDWAAGEALVGIGIAGDYEGLSIGGSLRLSNKAEVRIVGAFSAEGTAYESEVWVSGDVMRSALGWEGFVSSVTAELESPEAFDAFAAELTADPTQGLDVLRERSYYERASEGLSYSVELFASLIVFIFSFAAMLGAAITLYGAVGQRRSEIGVLRALGFSRREILIAFLSECALLAGFGAALGAGFALLTTFIEFTATNLGTGSEISFPFVPSWDILAASMALGLVVGLLGGFFPALKAARTDPAAAMRA